MASFVGETEQVNQIWSLGNLRLSSPAGEGDESWASEDRDMFVFKDVRNVLT